MDELDDEDIQLQRSSGAALSTLTQILPRILFRASTEERPRRVRETVRQKDLDRVVALIEPFQEEPQLLDSDLKHIIPPLVDAFTEHISQTRSLKSGKKEQKDGRQPRVPLRRAICKILYTLCKVRGEKVVSGFFKNEATWLEPILGTLEEGTQHGENGLPAPDEATSPLLGWEERYIILLWLSHLMLAPFPLGTIAPSSTSIVQIHGLELPARVPGIAQRVIPICIERLTSATRERTAAASLLARLALRPDMRKLGVLDRLVEWALSFFSASAAETSAIHQHLGVLTFLSRLITSARSEDLQPLIPLIYRKVQYVTSEDAPNFSNIRNSAVAKKLAIKILRNCITIYQQTGCDASVRANMESTGALEEVIEFLLTSLADRDTPVRYAASKALSMNTLKLEQEAAEEVVTAILESLYEDVQGGKTQDLTSVNSLRWHGLTLTLAQLLYRRSPSPAQLPHILNALILSLTFEQRSATGSSIGGNVRDAACFAIWSLSRRYTTEELANVDAETIESSCSVDAAPSVQQVLAMELVVAACLDPVGNIRRGSSAALQELVGRHPDTIYEGLSLVQIVDYHAVGLRQRAMIDVCAKASNLHDMYWNSLFRNILGWRGIGSPDAASRQYAAMSIGKLSESQQFHVVEDMIRRITMQLDRYPGQLEERHGLLLALSSIINVREARASPSALVYDSAEEQRRSREELTQLAMAWSILDHPSKAIESDLAATLTRSSLTAVAILSLMEALAKVSILAHRSVNLRIFDMLDRCLKHGTDEAVLTCIPSAVFRLALILSMSQREDLVHQWSRTVQANGVRSSTSCMGYCFALAGIFRTLDTDGQQYAIATSLKSAFKSAADAEARSKVLSAMRVGLLFPGVSVRCKIEVLSSMLLGLEDHTINERGDVGSLVRIEALKATQQIWRDQWAGDQEMTITYYDVVRLAVDKLDRVRVEAARALVVGKGLNLHINIIDLAAVSTCQYFAALLDFVEGTGLGVLLFVLMQGYVIFASSGSERFVQAARQALVNWLSALPDVDGPKSLFRVGEVLLDILRDGPALDYMTPELLDVFSFLFDMQIMQRLIGTPYKWRTLLSLVQKSHHKSNNIPKILAAINVYRGLVEVDVVRGEVLKKLASMLKHPFPKVRMAVAEALWMITLDEEIKPLDWGRSSKELEEAVERFTGRHVKI